MKTIIFLLLIIILSVSCKDNGTGSADNIVFHVDSTIFMYCNINSDIFYGKSFKTGYTAPDSMSQYSVIIAYFPNDIKLRLTKRMMLDNPKTASPALLDIDTMRYVLTTNKPYSLILSQLTDSLITGNFYGEFVNSRNSADTISLSNGYFKSLPNILGHLEVSMLIDNQYISTTIGQELNERNRQIVVATDSTFQDSLNAQILIEVLTLSDNFIKEYSFDQTGKSLRILLYIWSNKSDYRDTFYGQIGSVFVNSMNYYEEKGIIQERLSNLNFEIEASNLEKNIKITDGHFSATGF